MKKKSDNLKGYVILIAFILLSVSLKAQGFGDDVDDEVAAPINGLIWLLMIAGGSLGISKLKKK